MWASLEAVAYGLHGPSVHHVLIDNPGHLLRRQELTLGAGSARQQLSTKV
jgi:hypothetical protein